MARRILKYHVPKDRVTHVSLPETSTVRHFAFQGDKLYVWVETQTEEPCVTWKFSVYGTGWSIDCERQKWGGTTMTADHAFVWHLFYEVNADE